MSAENRNLFISTEASLKLKEIKKTGVNNLHIIADFDMTITKNYVYNPATRNFDRNKSAHGMFMTFSKSPQNFVSKTRELLEKYMPIEISTTIPEHDKIPDMIKWWNGSHELILGLGLHKSDLKLMVKENPTVFREGTENLFNLCAQNDIPMLIFSAGIADVIEEVLYQCHLEKPDELFHVVSNRMEYDDNGKIIGFKDPLIHVFNKNEATIANQPEFSRYKEQVFNRKNVILIGDSLGDARMAEGLKHDNVLKIGLLNRFSIDIDGLMRPFSNNLSDHECKVLLEKYQKVFDIVVTGDLSFDLHLNKFIESLL